MDTVSPEIRSRMMSGIRGKNTRPELMIRKALHRQGYRFRLHDRKLPGHPDLVFPRCQAVLFVHGCFWHGHDCHLFRWPKTRTEFWKEKISGNITRDARQVEELRHLGWRVGIIRECALKGKTRRDFPDLVKSCGIWLESEESFMEIYGDETRTTG